MDTNSNKCNGFFGWLFGHKFQAQYINKKAVLAISPIQIDTVAIVKEINQLGQHYINLACKDEYIDVENADNLQQTAMDAIVAVTENATSIPCSTETIYIGHVCARCGKVVNKKDN